MFNRHLFRWYSTKHGSHENEEAVNPVKKVRKRKSTSAASEESVKTTNKLSTNEKPIEFKAIGTKKTIGKVRPENESRLHFKSKQHLQSELSKTSTLSVIKTCSTRSNLHAPSIAPFWTCTNTKVEQDFIHGWDSVALEYRCPPVGIFDVALLKTQPIGKPKLVGVVEVFSSSAMTDSKVQQLNTLKAPWVEFTPKPSFYHPSPGFGPPWQHSDPLPACKTSDGDWQCHVCNEGHTDISFVRVAAVVDIFQSSPTYHGNGQLRRKVFAIYSKRIVDTNNQERTSERQKHYFLVEGCQILTGRLIGLDGWDKEPILLKSSHFNQKPIEKGNNWDDRWYIPQQDLDFFEEHFMQNLVQETEQDAGVMIDVKLNWPGETVPEFFSKYDKHSALINYKAINNVQAMFISLPRIFGHSFRYDKFRRRWIPTKKL